MKSVLQITCFFLIFLMQSTAASVLKDRFNKVLTPNEKSLFKQSLLALIILIPITKIRSLTVNVGSYELQTPLILVTIVIFNLLYLLIKYVFPEGTIKVDIARKETPIKPKQQAVQRTPIQIIKSPLKQQQILLSRSNIPINNQIVQDIPSFQKVVLPQVYQNALKPTINAVKEIIEDGVLFIDQEQSLLKFRCKKFIEVWSENMRSVSFTIVGLYIDSNFLFWINRVLSYQSIYISLFFVLIR